MLFKRLIRETIFVFATILVAPALFAQKSAGYETISTSQGLSQGMVFDLLQDREGFIWVATKNGLNRYDGYGFKVYSNDPYNPHSLGNNTIIKLLEDSKGRIWVGTEAAGINIYDKKSGKFYRIMHRPSDPSSLSGNVIRSIEELPDGRMLVATDGAGLNVVQLTDAFFTNGAAPVITRLTLPSGAQVYGMGRDPFGRTWIGGLDGSIYQFNPLRNSFAAITGGQFYKNGFLTEDSSVLINHQFFLFDGKEVYPLFDTSKIRVGNLVFRTKEKLWENHFREPQYYDVATWTGGSLQWNVKLPEKVSFVYPFIVDRSGNIWSGSVGYGLRKYTSSTNKFKAYLLGYSVRWIVPTNADRILVGDYVYHWRRIGTQGKEDKTFTVASLPTQIDNILVTRRGDYWLKSDDKGYFNYQPTTGKLTSYPAIKSFYGIGDKQPALEDRSGRLWFPGLGGHITMHDPATGKTDSININTNAAKPMQPKAILTALFQDAQGTFWAGTQEGFARVRLDQNPPNKPQINWYYNNSENRNSLNYNHVSCFLDDPYDPATYLWICTKGGGLNCFNKKTGDFFHLTTKNGLPHDVVYGILADGEKNIWGSTNNGIFCLLANASHDSTKWFFRNFTKAHGLQDDEFNTGAYAKLPGGKLAFGGVNGLNIFDPKEILSGGFTPAVFITNIQINNAPVQPDDKTGVLQQNIEATNAITLTYEQDILTLEFSSLDFTAPIQNRYRYQLVGVDDGWVESNTRRTATYLHLPPGNYVFRVQGSNSQGIWSSKISELKITVLPPWWRTLWAYVIYGLVFVIAIRAYFRFWINRTELKSQLAFEHREAQRMKELDTLKTQLYTNITHEFRTPLTVIMGMAQQVVDKRGENVEASMNMILRNGQSLLNLVNEMLDLAKLDSGKMAMQPVAGDVMSFLRYVAEPFQTLAESGQKGMHFLTEIDTLVLSYDPEKLRQIVVNLLSNAVKFTPEKGNIYFTVTKSAGPSEDQIKLVMKVKDTGVGIPESQLPHIFDRFYQLDNSTTRIAEGTGIGLALTKELVKLMEGDIAVQSPLAGTNKGTEFTVILPMQKAVRSDEVVLPPGKEWQLPKATISYPLPTDENRNGEKPLVLLVEDNADVVAYTASCLTAYNLAVAKDGQEGFELAVDLVPDLIITDVMMPLMDGFVLCKQLHAHINTSHIPIIMLTARADIESKLEGLTLGADAYLHKPFHKEELLVQLKKLLVQRIRLQQHYLQQAGFRNNLLAETIVPEVAITPYKEEDAFVKKVRESIEANLANPDFTVEQLCRLVFMSHSQLHRKLEALTGLSPNKFIRAIRLAKAQELLKDATTSISSVAYDCGFADPGYFARVFRQEFEMTPQEWRVSNKVVS